MSDTKKSIKVWEGKLDSYKLLDSGEKEKLEEIGGVKIRRAEPRAWWNKTLPESEWGNTEKELEKVIDIGIGEIKAKIKYKNTSKHIGIFPEQISEWEWISEKLKIENSKLKIPNSLNVLNLFGYTGIATLAAVEAGAKVTHVDASKASVDWARENQKLSGLGDAPIRWIVDDCIKFLNKEARNGKKYDAIIMDPPSYGKGPKGEVWKIEEQLPELLKACKSVLSDNPLFIIFNMYSTELSSISVGNLLSQITEDLGGTLEVGELAIPHYNNPEKLLPMSIFAIWENK